MTAKQVRLEVRKAKQLSRDGSPEALRLRSEIMRRLTKQYRKEGNI